ncbi:hypothetical protein [Streptomyces sp. NPDC054838]
MRTQDGCRETEAAARLGVPEAALRWAVHIGAVPAPDAGPGEWSRAAVEAMDAEAIRARLPYALSGAETADRLAQALGTPNPPGGPARVSVATVREMVAAGFLVDLSDVPDRPLFQPDQVADLAGRADLDRLIADAALLGPEQCAARLRVRRTDFDHLVRLGWITCAQQVKAKFGAARGGTVRIPLYRSADVDRIPTDHPEVDWPAVRAVGKGRRSPFAELAAPSSPAPDAARASRGAR